MKNKSNTKKVDFDAYLKKKLKNKRFRKLFKSQQETLRRDIKMARVRQDKRIIDPSQTTR